MQSEARFRMLFEQSPLGISIARTGIVIYCNNTALGMFGYQCNEIIGTHQVNSIAFISS